MAIPKIRYQNTPISPNVLLPLTRHPLVPWKATLQWNLATTIGSVGRHQQQPCPRSLGPNHHCASLPPRIVSLHLTSFLLPSHLALDPANRKINVIGLPGFPHVRPTFLSQKHSKHLTFSFRLSLAHCGLLPFTSDSSFSRSSFLSHSFLQLFGTFSYGPPLCSSWPFFAARISATEPLGGGSTVRRNLVGQRGICLLTRKSLPFGVALNSRRKLNPTMVLQALP